MPGLTASCRCVTPNGPFTYIYSQTLPVLWDDCCGERGCQGFKVSYTNGPFTYIYSQTLYLFCEMTVVVRGDVKGSRSVTQTVHSLTFIHKLSTCSVRWLLWWEGMSRVQGQLHRSLLVTSALVHWQLGADGAVLLFCLFVGRPSNRCWWGCAFVLFVCGMSQQQKGCASGTGLLKKYLNVLPHWDKNWSNLQSHIITVHWHRVTQFCFWPRNAKCLAVFQVRSAAALEEQF